jgi:hypothetical protein
VRKHGKDLKKILRGNRARNAHYTMMGTEEPLDLTLAIVMSNTFRERTRNSGM